jgi:hypothetical protein
MFSYYVNETSIYVYIKRERERDVRWYNIGQAQDTKFSSDDIE